MAATRRFIRIGPIGAKAMAMSASESLLPEGLTIRHDLKPGDLGAIVRLHGVTYAAEHGFDCTFEAYVAEPLAVFARSQTNRDRLWTVERESKIVGCVPIFGGPRSEAQLRWFLVDPTVRRMGLGRQLIVEALSFCRHCGYESVFLWTVSELTPAARLYRSLGFAKVEEKPGHLWGVDVVEEKYLVHLGVRR